MHRARLIESPEFLVVEIVAATSALFAIVLSIGGMGRIWVTGDRGWGRALGGLLFGLISLFPLGYVVSGMVRNPAVLDVGTTSFEPPGLGYFSAVSDSRPQVLPGLGPHSYPVDAPQIFALAATVVDVEGWEVVSSSPPTDAVGTGQLNAVATTLLGWRDEVAIRVSGDGANTVVDVRSASLGRTHDLGDNARRIAAFLTALDEKVTLYQRDSATPAGTEAAPAPVPQAIIPPPTDAESPEDGAPEDSVPD